MKDRTHDTRSNSRRIGRGALTVSFVIGLISLGGCITGERPRLVTNDTIPSVDDRAINSVIETLASAPLETSFTVSYMVVTRFGGQSFSASIAVDPSLGTALNFGRVRYIYAADGTLSTCSDITEECRPGIDETRVSDRQVNSRIFQSGIIDRLQQDANVAVGDSLPSARTVADRPTTCASVPVVDSTGITREKTYCAFDELGVLAFLDTADLLIEATVVNLGANPADFTTS
ncbi:MAG: hypothetical protein ACKOD2_15160 [Ilumatobacteraceae bacterium]